MPLAYLIATLVTGLGLLIGYVVHVAGPEEVARQSVPLPSPLSSLPSAVGRITGMVDCKWAKEGSGARGQGPGIGNLKSHVSLGQTFALASGLMKITYDTGATVILQGPVTYSVEANGGYLAVGKLTGKLEARGERRGERGEGAANHQISNLKSQSLNPSPLSPLLSPLFVIRTPTAIVTDLGTEFGIEVTKDGQNHVHVFQGTVKVRTQTPGAEVPREIEMNAGESASVDARGAVTRCTAAQAPATAKAIGFVRTIPRRVIKTLNLVDVVAGGDGFGVARGRGINPNTGEVVKHAPPADVDWKLGVSDGRYHRVKGLPFIDGVFVPDDRRGPVQLDSAGHSFAHFGTSDDSVFDYLWAGGELPAPIRPTFTRLGFIDYGQPDTSAVLGRFGIPEHSALGMTANKGITFDLEAIRRANPGCRIRRFRTVAGNTDPSEQDGMKFKVDVWVFVDGQARLRALNINKSNSAFNPLSINMAIRNNDRFLTLVVSDGGDRINNDRVIFGDPQLDVVVCPETESTAEEAASR